MQKLTISFDLDSTIFDWMKKYRQVAHDCFPQYGELPESVDWDQSNWPLTKEERSLLHMTWMTMPNFYVDLELCEGVNIKFLYELNERVNLIFVSARHEHPHSKSAHQQSVEAIRKVIGIVDPIVVIAADKGPVLRAAQAVLHVDDAVHVLDGLHQHRRPHGCSDVHCHVAHGLLVEHSQNRGYTGNSFEDVMEFINSILWSHNVKTVPID